MCSGMVVCRRLTGERGVAGHPHAAMEHLDGGLRDPHLDHLADQPGRHRVAVPLDLDVVIRGDAAAPPFGILIGLAGSGMQRGPIDGLEELPPAGAELAHQAGVEFIDQRADGDVQLGQREEAPVAQPRQDPALAISTATSTLALSRGLRGRVGMMVVP